jgi:hypothetical protein
MIKYLRTFSTGSNRCTVDHNIEKQASWEFKNEQFRKYVFFFCWYYRNIAIL